MKKAAIILGLFLLCCGAWGKKVSCISETSKHYNKKISYPSNPVNIYTRPGTVRSNILRIAKQNGWPNVIWQPKNDYRWVSATKISAPDLETAFAKMLYGYPLQAVFYKGNHVLVIKPRTIK